MVSRYGSEKKSWLLNYSYIVIYIDNTDMQHTDNKQIN